ncbi:MAG: hypothetical protein JWO36_6476 [Myxococcales bacterium]|nr:hypothetical protein [Myxococcales bacterium]
MAAGTFGGVWLGVGRAVDLAGDYFVSHEASAAPSAPLPNALVRIPAAKLRVEMPAPKWSTIFDAPDEVLLAPLGATPVTRVKLNHGGTSLSLRLDFASGARAAFKPEQNHPQSEPRKEIAAYRIDRLLGIGHVAPAKSVRFTMDELIAATDPESRKYTTGRMLDEMIAHGGTVRGELQWWIPEIRDAKLLGSTGMLRVDELEGIALWTSYLQVGATIPEELRPLVQQLASCVLYDVVIDNADRWTGYNTKASPDLKTLYVMDNTLSFSLFTFGHEGNLFPLHRMQVFPRGLVEHLRGLTYESVKRALDTGEDAGELAPLLTPGEIRAILARRDHLVGYIDEQIAQFGETAVLALP